MGVIYDGDMGYGGGAQSFTFTLNSGRQAGLHAGQHAIAMRE